MKIFPKIISPVRRILTDLKTESEVACEIVYHRFSSQTIVDRVKTDNYDEFPMTAIRLRHTQQSADIAKSVSEVQAGDVIYMIDARDFPSGYSLKDKIVRGSSVEPVKAITPVFDLLFNVTVESSGAE
jgi:hypothetical protein